MTATTTTILVNLEETQKEQSLSTPYACGPEVKGGQIEDTPRVLESNPNLAVSGKDLQRKSLNLTCLWLWSALLIDASTGPNLG